MSQTLKNTILVEQKDGIVEIRINRPDKKNALDLTMYQSLADAIDTASKSAQVRAVIITGTSGCFTSGNDLSVFVNSDLMQGGNALFTFMDALRLCTKPVIAAVDGIAIGIGTTMLLHCDLVVASRSAEFKLPFVNLGLTPEYASSFLLPRLVGYAKASEWLLLGSSFNAQEGLSAGLVNRIDDAPLLMSRELAQKIAQLPPAAVAKTKALLKATINVSVERVLKKEIELFSQALQGPEFSEAAKAFFEKRAPNFSDLS